MQAETLSGQDLLRYVDEHSGELVELARTLVRMPSENTPPVGAERACQEYCAGLLRASGFQTEMYELTEVKGLREHALDWPGCEYGGRPQVSGQLEGAGGGRESVWGVGVWVGPPATAVRPTRAKARRGTDSVQSAGRGESDVRLHILWWDFGHPATTAG